MWTKLLSARLGFCLGRAHVSCSTEPRPSSGPLLGPQSFTVQMNLRALVTKLGVTPLCADWSRWWHPETGDMAVVDGKVGP